MSSVVAAGSLAKAASKEVRNRMSNYGSSIDQTSICDTGAGAGSMSVYKCTRNGSDATKFVFNVMSKNNPNLERHADGYLRVGGSEKKCNTTKKEEFGGRLVADEKGMGAMGSYIQSTVGGKFAAGITLAGE